MLKFYGHFAAAYGTIWLILMGAALVSQSHINAGEFGLYGFPIIAALYAAVRMTSSADSEAQKRRLRDSLFRHERETQRLREQSRYNDPLS